MAMCEGNPGAITVLVGIVKMCEPEQAEEHMRALNAMNMRGSQIWYAYKDVCHGSIRALLDCITIGTKLFVDAVN